LGLISNRKDTVAVIGVGTTDFGNLPEHDATSLGIWALRNAADDAGISLKDIDGLIVQRLTDYQKFIQITNISPRLVTATPGAGRMTGGTIQLAVQAVLSGLLDTVAVVYGNDGRSAGAKYGGKGDTYGTSADQLWFPYGMTSPGAIHAMAFQRHVAKYGTTNEQLAAISIAFRKHALLNPNAVMKKPITFLIMGVMLMIVTTVVIGLGFYSLPPTMTNLGLICCLSGMGYLGSLMYISLYREFRKENKNKPQTF
jgi:acetyl-CoA acetyltransferase